MSEILYSESTGKYYAKMANGRYAVVDTPEQAEIATEGAFEAGATSLGNSIGQLAAGASTLLSQEGSYVNRKSREAFENLRANQSIRSDSRPISSTVGSFAPDVALGALTGGTGTLAKRAGTTAMVEGALGAARNPDNPLEGALVQGGIGAVGAGVAPYIGAGLSRAGGAARGTAERLRPGTRRGLEVGNTVVDAARARNPNRALNRQLAEANSSGRLMEGFDPQAAARSVNAAVNPNPTDVLPDKAIGKGHYDADELLVNYGMPTSPAQRIMLSTHDPAEYLAARAADNAEFNEYRVAGFNVSPLLQAARIQDEAVDYGALTVKQQDALNRAVMREMGSPRITATRQNIGEARKRISDEFSEIADRAGPMDVAKEVAAVNKTIEQIGDGPVSAALQKARDAILRQTDPDDPADMVVTGRELMNSKNEIADMMRKAYSSQPTMEVGDALREVDEMLNDRLMENLDDMGKADLRAARHRWGVANSALRTAAATNPRGDINLRSFTNSYRRGNYRFKIGYADDPFDRFLDSAGVAMHRETKDSGTPQGNAALFTAIAESVATASGVPGAGILGNALR